MACRIPSGFWEQPVSYPGRCPGYLMFWPFRPIKQDHIRLTDRWDGSRKRFPIWRFRNASRPGLFFAMIIAACWSPERTIQFKQPRAERAKQAKPWVPGCLYSSSPVRAVQFPNRRIIIIDFPTGPPLQGSKRIGIVNPGFHSLRSFRPGLLN